MYRNLIHVRSPLRFLRESLAYMDFFGIQEI